jgi:chloramphenicol-sensitive protein RarD
MNDDDTPTGIPGHAASKRRSGFFAAMGAFVIWGLFPIYLKPLGEVPALEIMAHRIVWCCLLVFAWLAWKRGLGDVGQALAVPATRWRLVASALLISLNWLIYVWAIGSGHVLDSSLGYFINPLLNVALGVIVFSERLNRAQWLAVGLAAGGVIYLTIATGRPPWIALSLAATFGGYGLIRKVIAVESVPGLATETLLLLPFAGAYLLWLQWNGTAALGHSTVLVDTLLLASGLVTALPLAMFAFGARQIPLSTLGILQYIGPTLQFLSGLFIFHEQFPPSRAIGFMLIWTALAVYAANGLWRNRRLLRR